MEANLLLASRYDEWNDFVQSSPQSSIYSKTWYLDAVGKPYSIHVVEESRRIIAGIVIARNEIGQCGNPLLCKYLGVLFGQFDGLEYNRETKKRKICDALIDSIGNVPSFSYSFHPTFKNYLPFYWANYLSTTMYTYVLPLIGCKQDSLHKNLHKKLRSELKFADSQRYEIVDDLDFDSFYSVNSMTYERQGGSSPFKYRYLREYSRCLQKQDAIRFRGIRSSEGMMAVVGLVIDQGSTSLMFNGYDPRLVQRGANEWLIWSSIIESRNWSKTFDFEGSMMRPIDSFYRKFGGVHTPFLHIYKDNLLNYATQKARKFYKRIKYGK